MVRDAFALSIEPIQKSLGADGVIDVHALLSADGDLDSKFDALRRFALIASLVGVDLSPCLPCSQRQAFSWLADVLGPLTAAREESPTA